jgi:hypothetical protein
MSNADVRQMTVDEFLAGERQAIEALVRDYGLEVVGKLERVLLRDLIYERDTADRSSQHPVLITVRMPRPDVTSDAQPSRGGQQRFVADLKRWTERAAQGLLDDLLRRGAKIRERFWITPTIAAEVSSAALLAIDLPGFFGPIYSWKIGSGLVDCSSRANSPGVRWPSRECGRISL